MLTLTISCPKTPPTTAHTGDISEKQKLRTNTAQTNIVTKHKLWWNWKKSHAPESLMVKTNKSQSEGSLGYGLSCFTLAPLLWWYSGTDCKHQQL